MMKKYELSRQIQKLPENLAKSRSKFYSPKDNKGEKMNTLTSNYIHKNSRFFAETSGRKASIRMPVPRKLMMRKVCPSVFLLSLSLSLTGCMGIYEGGFECPPGIGVGCKSISDVNTMINRNQLPGTKSQETEENTVSYDERSPDSHLLTPESPEIWYAPSMRGPQKTTACPATIDAKYRSETQPVFKVEDVI